MTWLYPGPCDSSRTGKRKTPRERDIFIYGVSITRDGKRVDPRDFYIKPPWWVRLWRWITKWFC